MKCIFDLCDVKYNSNEDYFAFYQRFRSRVCNFLRKKGEKIDFLGGQELLEDEVLSPTFEDVIILWCLEKIDPKLQKAVREAFCDRLAAKNATLNNHKQDIFNGGSPDRPEADNFEVVTLDDDEEVSGDCESLTKQDSQVEQYEPENDIQIEEAHSLTEPLVNHEFGYNVQLSVVRNNPEVELVVDEDEEVVQYYHNFTPNKQTHEDLSQVYQSVPADAYLTLPCNVCGEHCADQADLEQHMRAHFKNPEICEFCQKGFPTYKNLVAHVRRTHDARPVTCPFCDKVFKNKNSMKFHTWSHFNKGIGCAACSGPTAAKFSSQSSFKEHLETVHKLSYEGYFKSDGFQLNRSASLS